MRNNRVATVEEHGALGDGDAGIGETGAIIELVLGTVRTPVIRVGSSQTIVTGIEQIRYLAVLIGQRGRHAAITIPSHRAGEAQRLTDRRQKRVATGTVCVVCDIRSAAGGRASVGFGLQVPSVEISEAPVESNRGRDLVTDLSKVATTTGDRAVIGRAAGCCDSGLIVGVGRRGFRRMIMCLT